MLGVAIVLVATLIVAVLSAVYNVFRWRGIIREQCGAEFEAFLRWYDVLTIRRGLLAGREPEAVAAELKAFWAEEGRQVPDAPEP